MKSVTTFSKKPLLCLVTAQAVCLALGLWIQDRLVAFSLRKPPATAPVSASNDSSAKLKAAPPSDRELLDAMQIARVFSFLWIAGMQGGIAYLVLSRAHSESSQRQMQAVNDSLLREKDLARTQNAVIFGLAKLAESRDPATGQHLERIAHFSTRFATVLRRLPKYRSQVTPAFIRSIGISSALHDIGKVGIEDQVLLKPGLLDAQERHHIQLHAALGGECLREIELQLGSSNFLEMAREIAFCHHEHWDGGGYPAGLAGEAIPLAARIVAIADVYDALSVRRVYKQALPHEECVEIIVNEAGQQFDPDLVDVFLSIESDFREIARKYASPTDTTPAASSEVKKPQARSKSSDVSDLLAPSTEPAPDIPSVASR
ncbi:MAG TPA: HD domain-containing phosphohydrolase [Pirellulales bacterium]|jgi:response regulator RpfG family c-di-GMP phosphodiesterase|nr:HD domain-containing phosphohydrolase [Pirellulales bacterium]